jgi:hypothetical protein
MTHGLLDGNQSDGLTALECGHSPPHDLCSFVKGQGQTQTQTHNPPANTEARSSSFSDACCWCGPCNPRSTLYGCVCVALLVVVRTATSRPVLTAFFFRVAIAVRLCLCCKPFLERGHDHDHDHDPEHSRPTLQLGHGPPGTEQEFAIGLCADSRYWIGHLGGW